MSRIERDPLVLKETGVTVLRDGTTAVNVGPIVAALRFLTEGRGEDRGTDEHGRPLPDLMSLAFDVVQSIILGGRKAEFFRRVKRELDELSEASGQSSLVLAKRAERALSPSGPSALDDAADELKALLGRVGQLPLDEGVASDATRALESFRGFGADRWVSATTQLLVAVRALTPTLSGTKAEPKPRRGSGKGARARPPKRPAPREESPAAPRKKAKRKKASSKVAPAKPRAKAKRGAKRRPAAS
jgi:hypothetical protein